MASSAVTGMTTATLGAELLQRIGLKSGVKYDAKAINDAFHAQYNALLDQLEGAAEAAKSAIKAELTALQAAHALTKEVQSIPIQPISKALLEKIPVQEGGLLKTAGSQGKAARGLVNTLFKDTAGEIHGGKVAAAVVAGVAVAAAVVGYFLLREDKPKSQVASVTDAELMATLTQRQV